MPDKTSPTTEESTTAEGGGAKKLIVSAVLCVVLIAVGFVAGGKLSGGAPAAAEGTDAEAEAIEDDAAPVVGALLDLDAINVNLAEGRYLRIAVSLGLNEEVHLEAAHGEEAVFPVAPAHDVVLSTFSGRSMVELGTADGREAARIELLHALESFYGEDIVTVYYKEFVMQ